VQCLPVDPPSLEGPIVAGPTTGSRNLCLSPARPGCGSRRRASSPGRSTGHRRERRRGSTDRSGHSLAASRPGRSRPVRARRRRSSIRRRAPCRRRARFFPRGSPRAASLPPLPVVPGKPELSDTLMAVPSPIRTSCRLHRVLQVACAVFPQPCGSAA
jgi:hypothetical protein